jgi:hypothetical protein
MKKIYPEYADKEDKGPNDSEKNPDDEKKSFLF